MKFVFAIAVFCVVPVAVSAQSFEEIVAKASDQVGEIGKYQEALQNPDQRFQYALIQQMLKLPDPALQRIAKEHALFSTNPVMREAAIKAILDSGTTLRMQIAATSEKPSKLAAWVTSNGGTFIDGRGEILWIVPAPKDDDCWGQRDCVFRQVGNSVQFNAGYTNVTMSLGNDGVLRGNLSYSNQEFAQVQVDLKE